MPLLEIEDLSIEYETESGAVKAVENVNVDLDEGETIGLVGESGCGKTTVAKSILRILPKNGRITSG
jgi:peptide/nickel transport system ATP-binding protein